MSANEQQVGGDHYRKVFGEQHWDRLVRLYGIDIAWVYFVGNATAYLERHRTKNLLPDGTLDLEAAIRDVEKAAHYTTKLAELYRTELQKRTGKPGSSSPEEIKAATGQVLPKPYDEPGAVRDRLGKRMVESVERAILRPQASPGHGCFGALGCDTGDHEWVTDYESGMTYCKYCGQPKE